MAERSFYTKKSSRIIAVFLSAFMIVTLAAPAVQAETVPRPVPKMSQIREMLEGRNYVEGDAIVVSEKGFNPASYINGDSEKLAAADEEALSLTADAARESEVAAHEVMADRADASRASSYNISVVHSDSLSTAALISKLYMNPKVISARLICSGSHRNCKHKTLKDLIIM